MSNGRRYRRSQGGNQGGVVTEHTHNCELCDASPAAKEVKLDGFSILYANGPLASPARTWRLCWHCYDDAWAFRWRVIAERIHERHLRETDHLASIEEVGSFMTLWRAAFARANGLERTTA